MDRAAGCQGRPLLYSPRSPQRDALLRAALARLWGMPPRPSLPSPRPALSGADRHALYPCYGTRLLALPPGCPTLAGRAGQGRQSRRGPGHRDRRPRRSKTVMLTIDAQVHAYERNHPGRPWVGVLQGPAEVTGDQMVAAMDAVGVDGAILVSPFSLYRYDRSEEHTSELQSRENL